METRSSEKIALKFDQFNVHVHGEKLRQTIGQMAAHIEKSQQNGVLPFELLGLCKKVAIYHTFFLRDAESASKFAQLALNTSRSFPETKDDPLQNLILCNLLGAARSINPDFKDTEGIFIKASKAYVQIQKTSDSIDPSIQLMHAQTQRYMALMSRRKGENEDIEEGLECIKKAILIEKMFVNEKPEVKLSLAESYHIKAILLVVEGSLSEAQKCLEVAAQLEAEFVKETKALHFLYFITQQNLAINYMKMSQNEIALAILLAMHPALCAFYHFENHTDVAKSLHFIGEAYFKLGQMEMARQYLQEAVDMKLAICQKADSPVVLASANLLEKIKEQATHTVQQSTSTSVANSSASVALLVPTISVSANKSGAHPLAAAYAAPTTSAPAQDAKPTESPKPKCG